MEEAAGEAEVGEGEEAAELAESVFSPCHSAGVWVRTMGRLWVSCKVTNEDFLSGEEDR